MRSQQIWRLWDFCNCLIQLVESLESSSIIAVGVHIIIQFINSLFYNFLNFTKVSNLYKLIYHSAKISTCKMGRSGDIQISNLGAVNVSEERRAWLLGLYFDGEIHSDSRKIWWNMTQVSLSSRKKTLVVSFAILLLISWTFAVKKWLL